MKKPIPADSSRPFPGVPVCHRYVGIGPIEEARQKLCRLIQRGEALGVVMGPPGTGKTLLCQKIASLHRETHEMVMLGDLRVSSRTGLVQQVLFHLGQPHQSVDEDSLHMSLVKTLTNSADAERPLLLVIDEAQMLSADLLDEVRMLTNLVRDGQPLVQTILVGSPRLEEALADPQLESLSQRIAARCYLHPLTHGETDHYIRTGLGSTRLSIDEQAVLSVHHASGGIPRLINHLMDRAIEIAVTWKKQRLDDGCIQAAWADIQQLPSPVLDAPWQPHGAAIEFGELDAEAFDFDNETTRPIVQAQPVKAAEETATRSSYSDIESILASTSIDCLSEPNAEVSGGYWADFSQCEKAILSRADVVNSDAGENSQANRNSPTGSPRIDAAARASKKAEPTTTRADFSGPIRSTGSTPGRIELFGDDYDQEMAIVIGTSPTPYVGDVAEEWQIHRTIESLSAEANSATGTTFSAKTALPPTGAADHKATRGTMSQLVRADELSDESHDIPREFASPLAIVWSDDDGDDEALDDRDMLVVEEELSLRIDTPESGVIASGAMRRPSQKVEQNYQNLFSRLRGRQ